MILEMKKGHLELEGEEDMGELRMEFCFSQILFSIFHKSFSQFLCYIYFVYFFSRGPNKYTRNWEDEDAYGKTTPGRANNKRFNKNNEDFPALGNSKVNITKCTLVIAIITSFYEYLYSFLS